MLRLVSRLLIVLFATVSSRPSLYDEPDPTRDLSEYQYRFNPSSAIITSTDITFNITVNESSINSQIGHDLTTEEIESVIDESSEQYLDKLLINQHIGHKLEFDPIQQIPANNYNHDNNKLIVNFHILLYYDTVPTNNNQQVIDINDLQHDIQLSSDEKYGKDTLHINLLSDDNDGHVKTTRYYSSTETLKYDNGFHHDYHHDHQHHASILLICIIILLCLICIFCVGFIIIIWYLKRIRNEQKQQQTQKEDECIDKRINSFITMKKKRKKTNDDICECHNPCTQRMQSLNLTVIPSNSTIIDEDIDIDAIQDIPDHDHDFEGGEHQNLMEDKIIEFKHEDDMSDSDKLYDFDIPGVVHDNEDIYNGKDIKMTPDRDNETIGK